MGSIDNSPQKSTRKPNANILWLMLSSLCAYNAVFTSLRCIYSAADTGVYNVSIMLSYTDAEVGEVLSADC